MDFGVGLFGRRLEEGSKGLAALICYVYIIRGRDQPRQKLSPVY